MMEDSDQFISVASYKETSYEDATFEIVGTPPSNEEFVPLSMAVMNRTPARVGNWLGGLPVESGVVAIVGIQVPATILVCIPIFLLVEKPFMNGPGSRLVERMIGRLGEVWRTRRAGPVSPSV